MFEERYRRRLCGLMVFFLFTFGFYVCRLGWLQIVEGKDLATIAARYHSRTVYYRWGHGGEGRGSILDRKLRPFTEARLQEGLAVFPSVGEGCDDYDYWLVELEKWTGLERADIILRSELGRPLPLKMAAPAELPNWIVPVSGEWDGEGNFVRNSYKGLACHVLGIIQPPFPGEQNSGKLIGRLGIEKYYDSLLRCSRPGVSALVDADGRLIPGLGFRDRIALNQLPNVVLSLDLEIQQLTERVFDKFIAAGEAPPTGALVVMDPFSGDILAMCSRPLIAGADNHCNLATRKPAAVDMQPLASLVKIVTAAAALEKDHRLAEARYNCTGLLQLGANSFICAHGPHGEQDLAGAMANSCNLYFAQLATAVGADGLLAMAEAMGLGGIELAGLATCEVDKGNLPEPADLATPAGIANNFAMGGNKIEATPLQAAVMLSSIANGGWRVTPRLVLAVNQDLTEAAAPPPVRKKRIMAGTTAAGVARLMRNVVVQGATGYFDHSQYTAAAESLAMKTGTSDPLPPAGNYLSWCGGFFPWQRPEYVIVYMAVAPKEWATVARGRLVAEIVQGLAELGSR